MEKDLQKARERSVNNLQRLYVIVVGLGLTLSLQWLIGVISDAGWENINLYYRQFLVFTSFIFILVPFFHGANRYLDATYVTGERQAKDFALIIDFLLLFAEALLLFVLAMVQSDRIIFYTILSSLLILDIFWVTITNLTAKEKKDKVPKFVKWATINATTTIIIILSIWSNLWKSEIIAEIILTIVVILRAVIDYYIVWEFYYPVIQDGIGKIPAPYPAPPPYKN